MITKENADSHIQGLANNFGTFNDFFDEFIMKRGLDILAIKNQVKQDRLIDGHGLMKILGIGPGKTIGVLLEQLEESHKLGEISTREEAILFARTLFARL